MAAVVAAGAHVGQILLRCPTTLAPRQLVVGYSPCGGQHSPRPKRGVAAVRLSVGRCDVEQLAVSSEYSPEAVVMALRDCRGPATLTGPSRRPDPRSCTAPRRCANRRQ